MVGRLQRLVKRLLPRTLLGRSVMILVTPLIIVQVVATWAFYDRHWDIVTKRLAFAVAGEIAMVIEGMHQFPGAENEDKIVRIGVNSVVVEDVEHKHEQTLPLEEQPG